MSHSDAIPYPDVFQILIVNPLGVELAHSRLTPSQHDFDSQLFYPLISM
jgi:hypothetical protein